MRSLRPPLCSTRHPFLRRLTSLRDRHPPLDSYLSRILNSKVYDVASETPLQPSPHISSALGNNILLKREDTQSVFSFKIRGAYNKIANIPAEKLAKGIVACSAGNHAQGVALAAARLGVHATIVMPVATPSIKVGAVKSHGGSLVKVKLFGMTFDEAASEAVRLVEEEGKTMIHPFNDPDVIAGQGTIGMEIIKQTNCTTLTKNKPVSAIFVCCGGGGMLAGIAAYIKKVRPSIKIIGVEARDAAGMTRSLEAGKVISLDEVGLFADGAAVRTVGDETFRICDALVDDMVTVSTDEICSAIKMAYNDTRIVLEPAGALAIAGCKKYCDATGVRDETMVALTSGANMDFDRMRFVSERADDSEKMMSVTIPEEPGSFRKLYSLIHPRNITGFSYRKVCSEEAKIFMAIQPLKGENCEDDYEEVLKVLNKNNYKTHDISNNELAKTHLRYMAGGRRRRTTDDSIRPKKNERLFRLKFPESPGALQRFLASLNITWNVSLFHYRNHGDDFGRVLVGLEVGWDEEEGRVEQFLETLGYSYVEETQNEVYESFLK